MTSASATARRPKPPPVIITCSLTFSGCDARDLRARPPGTGRASGARPRSPACRPAMPRHGVQAAPSPHGPDRGTRTRPRPPWPRPPAPPPRRRRCARLAASLPAASRRVLGHELGRCRAVSAALSSHSTLSASRPCIADQVSLATTATPRGISTTSTTPGTGLGRRGVERLHLAAERGGWRDHGRQHARQLHVDGELLPARSSWRRSPGGAASGLPI